MDEFLKKQSSNVNFCFWWHYLEPSVTAYGTSFVFVQMHAALLYAVRSHKLRKMGTDISCRDGSVTDRNARGIEENFVVKQSAADFNQVSPDQAQEWLNVTGKKGGGVAGITKTASALSRWALSYNLRSHVTADNCSDAQL